MFGSIAPPDRRPHGGVIASIGIAVVMEPEAQPSYKWEAPGAEAERPAERPAESSSGARGVAPKRDGTGTLAAS